MDNLRDLKKTYPWIDFGRGVEVYGQPYFIPQYETHGMHKRLVIGDRTVLHPGCVLYGGSVIRPDCFIGSHTVIREGTFIGAHTKIGNLTMIEGDSVIADHCLINSQVHITKFAKIFPYVFITPFCILTNDNKMQYRTKTHGRNLVGPTLKTRSQLAASVVVLPGVTIGEYAIAGAGSIVTKDIPDAEIWVGQPAKRFRSLSIGLEKNKSVTCPDHHWDLDFYQMFLLGEMEEKEYKDLVGNE